MSNFLNIVNGTTTQHALAQAGIPGDVSEYADVLHEGQVPADDDVDAFLRIRAQAIASFGWASFDEAYATGRAWQEALESFRDYDDVILWYEHDVFDQLLLIRLLNWWWQHAPVDPPMLVSPSDYLGPMSAAQLLAHYEARQRVTEAQLTLAASAWRAFTAPDPRELERIVRHENTAALPHLHGALLRMLEEYPSTVNGLGRTEQQIVEILAQSPLGAYDLFAANARREERVFMGDTTFFLRVRTLLTGPRAVVTGSLEEGVLRLTDVGERVLGGEADYIELNGLDRWIGGVRLTAASYWRWDGAHAVCVRAPS